MRLRLLPRLAPVKPRTRTAELRWRRQPERRLRTVREEHLGHLGHLRCGWCPMRKLKRLDQRSISGLRQEHETAEQYVRRVALAYSYNHNDVGRALTEQFQNLHAEGTTPVTRRSGPC